VAPEYRRLGLANLFMDYLEKVSDEQYVILSSVSLANGVSARCGVVCPATRGSS